MKKNVKPLQPNNFYHIYNRGINGCNIFTHTRNYGFFLQKYAKYIHPIASTYAYCLLTNHFHFLVKIRSEEEIYQSTDFLEFTNRISATRISQPIDENKSLLQKYLSTRFGTLFNAYSLAFNKQESRTGALFEKPFRRIEVEKEEYYSALVSYIHRNPQRHGIISDFSKYPYSSYQSHLSQASTLLARNELIKWFGDKEAYVKFHRDQVDGSLPIHFLFD